MTSTWFLTTVISAFASIVVIDDALLDASVGSGTMVEEDCG